MSARHPSPSTFLSLITLLLLTHTLLATQPSHLPHTPSPSPSHTHTHESDTGESQESPDTPDRKPHCDSNLSEAGNPTANNPPPQCHPPYTSLDTAFVDPLADLIDPTHPPGNWHPHVQAFYYLWYGDPATDGQFIHWNHEIMQHWNPEVAKAFPKGSFVPPNSLHSPFYPKLGPYSSSDPLVLRQHMEQLKAAGVNVMAVSWWGPTWREGSHDTQGVQTDKVLPLVIKTAEDVGDMFISFHMEPYPGRNATTTWEDLKHLHTLHGNSSAILRIQGKPMFFMYDSYRTPPQEWAQLLKPKGKLSIRGTALDAYFIGLWLNQNDGDQHILPAGFDGFYTYFASEATSFGSDPAHWFALGNWARLHGKLFAPSVGPGYNDSRIRPWNEDATRDREHGIRYERYWASAIAAGADMVTITSFNEWGEGTQIEPVVPTCEQSKGAMYSDYGPRGPDLYLRLTEFWGQVYRGVVRRRLLLPPRDAEETLECRGKDDDEYEDGDGDGE